MKFGLVESPIGVVGWKVTRLDGLASSAPLTAILPAKPALSTPAPVIAPVNGAPPSRKSGSAGPPVSEVAVVVVDTLLTAIVLAALLSTRSVVPAGLENCSPVAPRAAVS